MDFAKLDRDLKTLRGHNRSLTLLVAILGACVLVSLLVILRIAGSERTVVVPPALNKTFWVTNAKASAEYLEQMAGYVAWLILDVSPATIDWKKDTLLTWIVPGQAGPLKTRQDLEAERLKRINATTYFLLQQLVPSEETQSVVVHGRLRTLVNGQETSTEAKSYLAQFNYAGGRIHLETFKEIDHEAKPHAAASGARVH